MANALAMSEPPAAGHPDASPTPPVQSLAEHAERVAARATARLLDGLSWATNHLRAGLLLLAAVVAYSAVPTGKRASQAFYEAGAQIIPVLIVALAVERDPHRNWTAWPLKGRLQVFTAIAVGEVAALIALALGDDELPTAGPLTALPPAAPARNVIAAALQQGEGREYIVFSSQFISDLLTGLTVLGLLVGFAAVVWSTLLGETTSEWLVRTRVRRNDRPTTARSQFPPPGAHL
jgi:hypothetical protein